MAQDREADADVLVEVPEEEFLPHAGKLLAEVRRADESISAAYLIDVSKMLALSSPKGHLTTTPLRSANRSGATPAPTRKDEPCPPQPATPPAATEGDPADAPPGEELAAYEQRGLERARKRIAQKIGVS